LFLVFHVRSVQGAEGLHKLFLGYIDDEYSVVEVWIREIPIDKVREGEERRRRTDWPTDVGSTAYVLL